MRIALGVLGLCAALLCPAARADDDSLILWHSYRADEQRALDAILDDFRRQPGAPGLHVLAVPGEVLASKLTTAIPRGNGPDLFIFAHERVGGWVKAGLLAPVDDDGVRFLPKARSACVVDGALYCLPLALKSLALFYNRALVPRPPSTVADIDALGPSLKARDVYPLVYPTAMFYFHAPWFLGAGGALLDEQGAMRFDTAAHARSLELVKGWTAHSVVPEEVTVALASRLFREGRAAMTVNGPWFLGELDDNLDVGIAPLPKVTPGGTPASPLLTIEGVFVSARARRPTAAARLARFLIAPAAARVRARLGRQVVATQAVWDEPALAQDATLQAFRRQAALAVVTPNRPEMTDVWEPGDLALNKALRGGLSGEAAAEAAQRRYESITRQPPPARDPFWAWALAALLLLASTGWAARSLVQIVRRGQGPALLRGVTWTAPAVVATVVLVVVPFCVVLALSLTAHVDGSFIFVGLSNFVEILSTDRFGFLEPLSFYYALVVTVVWTAINVALHVSIGLGLALLLARPTLKLKAVYRVLLIVPWAVPNYITALIWKGLFHKQYGAINGLLELLGVGKVAWFSSFGTALFANICTNVWLGFPFMMVVSLGALQSIPSDLYEAADVDGASAWQKFRHITLPMVRPALLPAVILGSVWTFNQFNIVYLVSGGEPGNATDILISEAWRWAFARREQYGYASAYAALIFVILLGWSIATTRLSRGRTP